jgi:AraC-like DNA-binding protein
MSLSYEEHVSDSSFLTTVTYGLTTADGRTIRPAETNWHMVFVKHEGCVQVRLVGPWSAAGSASWGKGAEILWLRFSFGVFMPSRPTLSFRDSETVMPQATGQSFWLDDSVWHIPDFNHTDIFVERLARAGVLVRDPVVQEAHMDHNSRVSPRTVRHHFLQATGLTQRHIQGVKRAQQAAVLLQQGTSIADTVFQLGYFDQPHLNRSLKRFIGYTPTQLISMQLPNSAAISYKTALSHANYSGEVANIR